MSKYGAVRTNGYHSKKEAARANELRLMEKAGLIQNLREQVKYELIPKQVRSDGKTERCITYVSDFVYEQNGETVVEDSKGFRTSDYIIKRKLMLWIHKITIKET